MSNILKKCVVGVTTLAVLVGLGYANGASALTVEELQAQITALLAQITALQTQLADMGGDTGATITGCTISSFDRALMQTMSGDDVKCLQIILNTASDTEVAPSGVGSAGEETNYFGSLTKAAVIKFQEKYTADILATYGLTEGTGYVGTTTRAKLDALLGSGSGDPADPADPADPSEPAADGTVAVSLVSVSDSDLAKGSVGVDVAAFKFVSGAAATLDSIKLTRSGLGAAADYSAVYIYDGNTRLKSGRTISSESNNVEFTNIGLSLADGASKTITVKVDVYTSATTGHKNVLGVASLSDISVSGGTLTGSAMTGAEMEISAISIGTATLADGGTLAKPSIGATEGKVAKFKITAGNNDITFDAITLTNDGSISSSHLTNFVLKDPSGNTVATADAIVDDKITLTLSTPFAIGKVQNKTFSLYATIGAAKTTDGIRFYLDESSDVVITDTKYSQGAAITNSLAAANAKCVGSSTAGSACASTGSLQGGTITLSDNGPASDTISRETNNVELLNFSVVTTRDVTVKDYTLKVDDATNKYNTAVATGEADTFTVGTSGTLTVDAVTSFAVNDYIIMAGTSGTTAYATSTDMIARITAISSPDLTIMPVAGSGAGLTALATDGVSTVTKITAIRLVNADTDAVLYSNSTNRFFYSGASEAPIDASDDFDLDSGTTYNLSLRVDISAYSAPDQQLVGKFYLDTANDIKERDVNQYIAAADIVPSSLDGKTMTIGASSLTVAKASLPVSDTKVKGTNGVDVLGIALNAGSASDVTISNLVVRFLADADGNFGAGTGDIRANSHVSAVNLYDGNTKIAGPKSLTDSSWTESTSGCYLATFDSLSYVVPAGTSQKLTVKADVVNTTSTSVYLAATVDSDDDITVEDSDGNTISITADTYGSLNEDNDSTALSDVSPVVVITVSTAGTLSAKVEGTSDQAIVIAGASNVVMAKYKFSALDEAFTLDKLDVLADVSGTFATATTTIDNNIVQVGIKDVTSGVTKWSNIASGKASFSSLGINVPADGYVYVEVLADLNTIANGATSGETPRLGISLATTNTFRAVGVGSSVVKAYSDVTFTGESDVNSMTIRKTAPTIAKKAGLSTTLVNGNNTLYGFTVAADAAEAVSLKGIVFKVTGLQALTTSNFKFYRGTTDLTDKVTISNATFTSIETTSDLFLEDATQKTVNVMWDGTTEEIISAGNENTYYLKATVADVSATNKSISTYIADDSAILSGSGTDIVAVIPKLGTNDPQDLVEWSTTQEKYGSYSVKLQKTVSTGATGSTHLEFTPPAGITLADLDTIGATNKYSFWHYLPALTHNWLQLELKYEDPNTTGYAEVTIMPQQNQLGTAAWVEQSIIQTTAGATAVYGLDDVGGAMTGESNAHGVYTPADLSARVTVQNNAVSATDWILKRVRVELYEVEGATKTVYVDNVTIEGVEYGLENTNLLWSDNSNTSHTTITSDWFDGFLVNDLMTDTLTLTY